MTGSSGHLGEALVRVLRSDGHEVVGLDLIEASFTGVVGSICEPTLVATAMEGADAVIHSASQASRYEMRRQSLSVSRVNIRCVTPLGEDTTSRSKSFSRPSSPVQRFTPRPSRIGTTTTCI